MSNATGRWNMFKTRAVPVVTLALWRVRRTWGLLLVTGVGMIAAVMLACTGPLYSQVALTAGLHGALTAGPENANVIIHSVTQQISLATLDSATQTLNQDLQYRLGAYMKPQHFSIETSTFNIVAQNGRTINKPEEDLDQLYFSTQPMAQAAEHLKLLRGRLPRTLSSDEVEQMMRHDPTSADLDIALTDQEATNLNVDVGTELTIQIAYDDPGASGPGLTPLGQKMTLRLHISGIFTSTTPGVSLAEEPFWHDRDYVSISKPRAGAKPSKGSIYTALASSETFVAVFDQFYKTVGNGQTPLVLQQDCQLFWIYPFDSAKITIDNLNDLLTGVTNVQLDLANTETSVGAPVNIDAIPFIEQTGIFLPSDILRKYQTRATVVRVPMLSLLFLEVGLVLFFVSMMTTVLLDRQTEAIAILRSRGTSRVQVLGAFAVQSLGLGLLALLLGPLLALAAVLLLAGVLLPANQQNELALIASHPLQASQSVIWLALGASAAAIMAMVVSAMGALRLNILSLRQETARSTQRPFWQRMRLDSIALIVLVVGSACALYLTSAGILDAPLRLLLLTPLMVLGATCLLIASILLFLRLSPRLLAISARVAARNRGASPLLALAQIARAPRQPIRMILLLALATAFALFTLIFASSQAQRVLDVSAYQGGADFSGATAVTSVASDLERQTKAYRAVPGALAASLGYSGSQSSGGGIPIELRAVDSSTFSQAVVWTPQDSSQSINSLMERLRSQRAWGLAHDIVPAIVDASAASVLHLSPGATFVLSGIVDPGSPATNVTFVDVAEVQHIPTVSAGTQTGSPGDYVPAGGVIADYQTYAAVFQKAAFVTGSNPVPVNYVWLRTRADPASLTSVREALGSGYLQVTSLYDRRALSESLSHEPLFLDIVGALAIGATTALLLALFGNLLTSWLSVYTRLTNFAVMRALGVGPRQVVSVLLWEQGTIYTTGLVLGLGFGLLFSALVVPALVFTGSSDQGVISNTTSGAFYTAQSVPPIQVVFASQQFSLVIGVLAILCMMALGLMIRVVSRSSLGQALRLNED